MTTQTKPITLTSSTTLTYDRQIAAARAASDQKEVARLEGLRQSLLCLIDDARRMGLGPEDRR